jgi:hypothetical protein
MPTEIPTQIEFEHLLSHTFPGFFFAITIFMLLDVSSPYNLTQSVMRDINGLIAFAGFILLIGTICGVIIDNIHHSILEDAILKNFESVKIWNEAIEDYIKKCNEGNDTNEPNIAERDKHMSYQYFFNKFGPSAIVYEHYIRNAKYCYSEFFSNAFISLVPFSMVVPFFLLKRLLIPWDTCIFISITSLVLACFCLYSSYDTFLDYYQTLFSLIRGFPIKDNQTTKVELTLRD